MNKIKKMLVVIATGTLFALSLALIFYGVLIHKIERGNRAFLQGDYKSAKECYITVEGIFNKYRRLRNILKSNYQKLLLHEVKILYLEGKYDGAFEKLEDNLVELPYLSSSPQIFFWRGNILFKKAILQSDPEKFLVWIGRASDEYQKAIQVAPNNWDIKYNYEFAKKLLLENDKAEGKERMNLLLEDIRREIYHKERSLPPEKRG